MRVLFDNGTPRGVAGALNDHVVEEARAHGWDTLRNGELLATRLPAIAAAVAAATPGSFTEIEIPID